MTRQDFLTAILAAPDDDGPRLAYADWLEENGRAARAEFIRVQCALAKVGHRPAACEDPGCPCAALAGREQALVTVGRPATGFTARADYRGFAVPQFSRGFVDALTVSAVLWRARHERVCREHPVRALTLDIGPLPADTGGMIFYHVPLADGHVIDRIALRSEGRVLVIHDRDSPAQLVAARRGPFTAPGVALLAVANDLRPGGLLPDEEVSA